MVVPRGWILEDRREDLPRLFKPRPISTQGSAVSPERRARSAAGHDRSGEVDRPEQLQIDGTGEILRPVVQEPAEIEPAVAPDIDVYEPWQPDFDEHSDLGGLLEATSPLLARAFRGTDRPRR